MDSFWAKIAIFAVIIGGLVFSVKLFSGKAKPKEPEKSVYDVWEEDEKRLRPKPEPEAEVSKVPEKQPQAPEPTVDVEPAPEKPEQEEISDIDKMEAQRLFEFALTLRKQARLPGMSYNRMVKVCREIIEKYPSTPEAASARQMLGEVPERHWKRLNITEEEVNPPK